MLFVEFKPSDSGLGFRIGGFALESFVDECKSNRSSDSCLEMMTFLFGNEVLCITLACTTLLADRLLESASDVDTFCFGLSQLLLSELDASCLSSCLFNLFSLSVSILVELDDSGRVTDFFSLSC